MLLLLSLVTIFCSGLIVSFEVSVDALFMVFSLLACVIEASNGVAEAAIAACAVISSLCLTLSATKLSCASLETRGLPA